MTFKQSLFAFACSTLASLAGIAIGCGDELKPAWLLASPVIGILITLCIVANCHGLGEEGNDNDRSRRA